MLSTTQQHAIISDAEAIASVCSFAIALATPAHERHASEAAKRAVLDSLDFSRLSPLNDAAPIVHATRNVRTDGHAHFSRKTDKRAADTRRRVRNVLGAHSAVYVANRTLINDMCANGANVSDVLTAVRR